MSRSALLASRQFFQQLTFGADNSWVNQSRADTFCAAPHPLFQSKAPPRSFPACFGCLAKAVKASGMRKEVFRQVKCQAMSESPPHVEGAQEKVSQDLMTDMIEFLKVDLPNLFNEKGIDKTKYDEKVAFIDPITRYDHLTGYLLNIQMLRFLFSPIFELRNIKQSGPSEITTRWCMRLYFRLVPWVPEVIFTGRSIMTVNPATGRFNRHIDVWDSIQDNDYFSMEGLRDFLKQVSNLAQTPKGKQVPFEILKRTAHYEIRRYPSFSVLEASTSCSIDNTRTLESLRKYVERRSGRDALILPLLSWVQGAGRTSVASIPVETGFEPEGSADASLGSLTVREVGATCAAVVRFSGSVSEASVEELERGLREALGKDGIEAEAGYAVGRYSSSGNLAFLSRNEVLVWLREYELD